MKRTMLTTFILVILLCGTARKAFLASDREGSGGSRRTLLDVPVPPLQGRAKEREATVYLSRPSRTFDYWMSRGKQYLGRKEYEQAVWAFRKSIREKPLVGEAHFLLGVAYERRGLDALPGDVTSWGVLAEESYQRAIIIADFLPARHNLALLLERRQRFAEARREWEHILTIAPDSYLGRQATEALNRNIAADLLPQTLSSRFPDTSGLGRGKP